MKQKIMYYYFVSNDRIEKSLHVLIGDLMLIDEKLIELRRRDPCLVYQQKS